MAGIGFLGRTKRLWYAFLNLFIKGVEDKYLTEIAEMQIFQAQEELKEGKEGLVTYQTLVNSVAAQVEANRKEVQRLTSEIKTYRTRNREYAAKLALTLDRAKKDLQANEEQLSLHQKAYENNLLKMKDALKRIADARRTLEEKRATLKVEQALATVAETAAALNAKFDSLSDFGEIIGRLDERIYQARAKGKVAADLSEQGVEEIEMREETEKQIAEDLLLQFEIEQGLVEPPTQVRAEKTLGPSETKKDIIDEALEK